MPGTERSLRPFNALVERLLIGDRVEKGRSQDHLILPLTALKRTCTALLQPRREAWWRVAWVRAGGVQVEGCTGGVLQPVYSYY